VSGQTIGVEEEYHLVDARTWSLADAPQVVHAAHALLGEDARGEISTSQLELATPVCTTLGQVRAQLQRLRRGADEAARAHGCRILPAATHPTATWRDQRLSADERYVRLHERFGVIALQQLITGCHVHVGIPDPELVVPVLDRLRPDLPVLLAMSASSPFWEGVDTGCASFRTSWFAHFPMTGMPEVLGTRAAYDALVADLAATGMIEDGSHLYWDARPSTRFPTLEVRVADMMPMVDDVVLHAALVRSLVRTAAAQAERGDPPAEPRPELARAARWRAARFGLDERLVDLRASRLAPAADVVHALLQRLRDDLEQAGEWDEVHALTQALLARGTSAARQRRTAEQTGSLAAVARAVCEEAFSGGTGPAVGGGPIAPSRR
jgi:YbdK family carboxylate-amine ligase